MSDQIVVTSVNASYMEIDTDIGIQREINEFFTFYANNYKYMSRYKNGLWDGKVRLFNYMSSTLPAGLFNILVEFAKERDYEIVDNRFIFDTGSFSMEYLDSLNVQSDGKKIKFRKHQIESIKEIINEKRATIVSATSSGKSLIIYGLIRYFSKYLDSKILIITPTVNLVTQMYKDFDDYSFNVEWNVDDEVHMIYDYDGVTKDSDKQIYISTWQSIYKQPKSYFKKFGFVIFDEVHQATAESVVRIMDSSENAWIRAGFTGTLKDEKLHKLKVNGLFGGIKKVISTREMIDAGYASKLHIKILVLEYNKSICKEINRKVKINTITGVEKLRNNYTNEISYITELDERNEFITNLVSVLDGNVLVLFNKIEKHGKPLFKKLKKRLDKDRKVYYISGETKAEDRELIRESVDSDINSVLAASYGTLSTGVNIKNLNYVIFASPYKSEIKVLQSIGRVLRLSDGKNKAVVFDLVDDMTYGKKHNYCFLHFMKRMGMYKTEKFPMSVSKYKLI